MLDLGFMPPRPAPPANLFKAPIPVTSGLHPVTNKNTAECYDDKRDGNEGPQNRKDREAVRCSLKSIFAAKGLCCEPDLHCGQDNNDVERCTGQPGKVVMKESAILIPAAHVATQRGLREGVYLVQAAQTQLAVLEAGINMCIDALRIQLPNEYPPCGP